MRILVIDGQGGGIGSRLVALLKPRLLPGWELLAAGTNVLATNAMPVNAVRADIILGPIGVILANGLMGEVPPAVASAVSGAEGVKILIPSNACGTRIAGTEEMKLEEYLRRAVELAAAEMEKKSS